MFGKTELLKEKLRKGEVYIKELFSNNNFKISKLTLKPESEIVKHFHTDDNEVYFIYEKGKEVRIEVCKKGQSHSLVNYEKDDIIVYAVKCK